jgi:methionyl-tRNA formyltransferase
MRIVILTSDRRGTASFCLPLLLEKTNAVIAMVILSQNQRQNKWNFYKKKVKKIFRIGIFGALNGIRMRKWFQQGRVADLDLKDIEVLCNQHNIPFVVTPYINSPQTINSMRSCEPDLGLSLGNSYISPKVFKIPTEGMLNIHGEILPDFQNAQSVIWQLFEGKSETGYTIHKIDKGIDTGNILKQEKFPIVFKNSLSDTVSANCAIILQRSALGLAAVINDYDNHKLAAYQQGHGKSYTTPTILQYFKIKKQFKKLKDAKTAGKNPEPNI